MFAAGAFAGDWVQFTNETSERLVASLARGINDTQEKDYAWGDVDRDGDIDLIVVRKELGPTPGRRRNVLFMNEDGVLVDRTNEYGSAADDGGQGLLDLTNDRDVALVDVDGDQWLDIVTAPTYSPSQPKTISNPRIYMNLGHDDKGNWLGFRYEEVRIPEIPDPNFCTVGFGDVTGDGAPDLYFGDYDLNAGGMPPSPLDDRLLVNLGNGFFIDETNQRVTPWLTESGFTAHIVIADVNHDGVNDIIKNSALEPYDFKVAYNDPDLEGFFSQSNGELICVCTEYFVAVGDLNNDGLLDLVDADDGADRYFLNQGNGADGKVNWLSLTLPDPPNQGFDNNTVIADLDNDGWNDILIADVDVDLPSPEYRLDIYHNLANPPFVTFQEDVGNLPTNSGGPLRGTHDIAVFDINGDCWLDLVIGNCDGTTVWINQGKGNICPPMCPWDLDGSGDVGVSDFLDLLGNWGPCPPKGDCPADFDGDGAVGVSDFLELLGNWGPCS